VTESAASAGAVALSTDGPSQEAVEIRGLTKRFGRATVLSNVDLTISPGEIHALVGQNGSGKSTLIKILSGVYAADAGEVSVGGQVFPNPVRPADLRHHNLAFVHQDLGLVDDLTVVENVRVGQYEPGHVSRNISWSRERRRAEETFKRLNAAIQLDGQVGRCHCARAAGSTSGHGLHRFR